MFDKENQYPIRETMLKLLTVREIARILSLGVSTIYLLIQRRELRCVRIGRAVRVRQDDLEAFIESKVVKGNGY